MRLALALKQPLFVIERMDDDELSLWMAFERLYGILGPQRSDLQNGNIVSLMYNMNRGKGIQALKIGDAMQPQWEELRQSKNRTMTEEDIRAQMFGFVETPKTIKEAIRIKKGNSQ